jgi:transcription elongation factor Elf1
MKNKCLLLNVYKLLAQSLPKAYKCLFCEKEQRSQYIRLSASVEEHEVKAKLTVRYQKRQ